MKGPNEYLDTDAVLQYAAGRIPRRTANGYVKGVILAHWNQIQALDREGYTIGGVLKVMTDLYPDEFNRVNSKTFYSNFRAIKAEATEQNDVSSDEMKEA